MNLMKLFLMLRIINKVYFFSSICIFIKKKPQAKEGISACVCMNACSLTHVYVI